MRLVGFLAMAAFLMAGCSSTSPSADAPSESITTVTNPADFTGNASGAHLHDYWQGGERLVVMETTHPGGTAEGAGPGVANGESVPVMEFRPDSGHVVPQGASSVEVTLGWLDAVGDSYVAPQLWVKTAARNESQVVGPIESGQTVSVTSSNLDNDLPHQLLSAWVFELRMSSPDPMPLRFKGSVSIKVEAIKGLDIPLYPAHPDRWQGQNALPLLQGEGSLTYFEDPIDHGCNGQSCPQIFVPDDGAIVPYDSAWVEVVLESGGALPVELAYHGGATREFQVAQPIATQGAARTYELPIEGADGPYAQQSQWEFTVVPSDMAPVALAAETNYVLTVTVHKR
ncbi:MAG: hypothetical protein WC876_09750 [Candidatus Thermoplasmatota archaeon]